MIRSLIAIAILITLSGRSCEPVALGGRTAVTVLDSVIAAYGVANHEVMPQVGEVWVMDCDTAMGRCSEQHRLYILDSRGRMYLVTTDSTDTARWARVR